MTSKPLRLRHNSFHRSGHRVRSTDGKSVSTVAGSGIRGYRDGPAHLAAFNHPYDVAADQDGVYIADAYNHVIRRYITSSRTVTTVAGEQPLINNY